ncbi:MAG: PQQ-dependent sugar dehydrogenase [Planctomycetota bacterium]|nr:PQQ-dependent sugar dehydrogenase [Planctomycetota bacterium]
MPPRYGRSFPLPAMLALSVLATILLSPSRVDGDEVIGIEARVPWTTSRITGSPHPPAAYGTERVFPKLQFENPVVLTNAPGTARLFVAELQGRIYSFFSDQRSEEPELLFDLKQAVREADKLYGLAFHPQFQANRYCYICYTIGENVEDGTRVSRFAVSKTDPPVIDPVSEQLVITWQSGGHNGGCLKFGLDGFLYISTGDGGPAFPPDPLMSGQDVSNLLACILRIDVDRTAGTRSYAIPADNPFIELEGARGEIWSYGHRNPWRMSVDSVSGDLWVGDVGWELWEMVYRVERGANYGWSLVEGPQPVHRERTRGPSPIVAPTAVHSHIEARSITGGHVYRGERLPGLNGCYVYGDYVTGKLWALRHDGTQVVSLEEIADTPLAIICFGVDNSGELYVVGYDGTIHRLVEHEAAAANASFPTKLSETGLFTATKEHTVAPGVIPYSINAEPWMDGAVAERFVALPGTGSLGIYETSNAQVGFIKGKWQFPTDAVLMKTISLALETGNAGSLRRLETQILHFDADTWRGYTYVWNDAQTDAELRSDRAFDRTFEITDASVAGGQRKQTWHFASSTECLLCHTTRGGSIYGFVPSQLDREHRYGDVSANQLATLKHLGLFKDALSPAARMASPDDDSAPLEERARSYLHINCAHCHQRGGGGTAAMDVQHHLSLEKTNLLLARPTQGTFGIHRAEVLGKGDPSRSVLLYRMAKLGRGRMPYIGSSEVDVAGVLMLREWIASLSSEAPNSGPGRSRREERARTAEQGQDEAGLIELLSTTSGALRLLDAIDSGSLGPAAREQAIAIASQHEDVQVRDLFERFLPADMRTQRLGASIDPIAILQVEGDADRGRKLFFDAAGIQCKNCHRIRGQGRELGPDLSDIGKRLRMPELLESILDPSKRIDPKYVTHLVETSDGRVLTGVLVERTDDAMRLKDAQAKEVLVALKDIEFTAPQQKSLMPELQLQDMTAEQVRDLLAFLASQR